MRLLGVSLPACSALWLGQPNANERTSLRLHPLNVHTPGHGTCFSHWNLSQGDTNRAPKRARDSRLEPGPSPILLLSIWGEPAGWQERHGQVARHPAVTEPAADVREATPGHSAPGTPVQPRRTSPQPHAVERKFVVPSPLHLGSFVTQQSSPIQLLLCPCRPATQTGRACGDAPGDPAAPAPGSCPTRALPAARAFSESSQPQV